MAFSLFWENFQMFQQPIRCSRPRRPCGPAGIGQMYRLSEKGRWSCSGVRVAEMALRISDAVPEYRYWSFEAGFHAKIAGSSPTRYIWAMKFTARTVFFVSSDGRLCSSWRNEPKHMRKAYSAMFESSSCDCPMPIGCPIFFSFGAALRTFSHVFGSAPTPVQRSYRHTTGSGT